MLLLLCSRFYKLSFPPGTRIHSGLLHYTKKRTLSEKTCLPPARMLRTETSLLYRRVTKAPLDTQEKDDPPSLEIHSRTYL